MCQLATLFSALELKPFKGFSSSRSIIWNNESFMIRDHSWFTSFNDDSNFCYAERVCSPKHSSMHEAQVERLLCLRPSMLVFRSWWSSFIEPYWPSRFAHQFNYTQGRVGLPRLFFHGENSVSDRWRAWCDFSTPRTRGHFSYPLLVGRDIGDTLSSHVRWYVISLGGYLQLGDDTNFISGVSCPRILGTKSLANKQSQKAAGTSFLGALVVKKRRSSMAAPRVSANLPLSFSGSLT